MALGIEPGLPHTNQAHQPFELSSLSSHSQEWEFGVYNHRITIVFPDHQKTKSEFIYAHNCYFVQELVGFFGRGCFVVFGLHPKIFVSLPQNEADRTLIYITLYISECLKKLQKVIKLGGPRVGKTPC